MTEPYIAVLRTEGYFYLVHGDLPHSVNSVRHHWMKSACLADFVTYPRGLVGHIVRPLARECRFSSVPYMK